MRKACKSQTELLIGTTAGNMAINLRMREGANVETFKDGDRVVILIVMTKNAEDIV
jgi:hypothetical protein